MARIVFTTQRNDSTTLPMATALTRPLEKRRPKMPLIRNPASGKIGMSQSCISSVLVFHRIDVIDVECRAILEHRQNDRQAYRRFGGRHHHHEEREEMAGDFLVLIGESYEAQVNGIQHQLDAHEYRDDIAPEEEARDAEGEKDRA